MIIYQHCNVTQVRHSPCVCLSLFCPATGLNTSQFWFAKDSALIKGDFYDWSPEKKIVSENGDILVYFELVTSHTWL